MKMGKPEKDSEANMFVGVQGKALQQQDEQSSLDDKSGGRGCPHLIIKASARKRASNCGEANLFL